MAQTRELTGTFEGTGAEINVSLGFKPIKVQLLNIDGLASMEWLASMAPGTGFKRITDGTASLAGANAVSIYEGEPRVAGAGFTLGTDADLNVNGETVHYIAIGYNE